MQRTSLKLDVLQEIEEYTSGLGNSDVNKFRNKRGMPVMGTPNPC